MCICETQISRAYWGQLGGSTCTHSCQFSLRKLQFWNTFSELLVRCPVTDTFRTHNLPSVLTGKLLWWSILYLDKVLIHKGSFFSFNTNFMYFMYVEGVMGFRSGGGELPTAILDLLFDCECSWRRFFFFPFSADATQRTDWRARWNIDINHRNKANRETRWIVTSAQNQRLKHSHSLRTSSNNLDILARQLSGYVYLQCHHLLWSALF